MNVFFFCNLFFFLCVLVVHGVFFTDNLSIHDNIYFYIVSGLYSNWVLMFLVHFVLKRFSWNFGNQISWLLIIYCVNSMTIHCLKRTVTLYLLNHMLKMSSFILFVHCGMTNGHTSFIMVPNIYVKWKVNRVYCKYTI